jgi:hypothetical protein
LALSIDRALMDTITGCRPSGVGLLCRTAGLSPATTVGNAIWPQWHFFVALPRQSSMRDGLSAGVIRQTG